MVLFAYIDFETSHIVDGNKILSNDFLSSTQSAKSTLNMHIVSIESPAGCIYIIYFLLYINSSSEMEYDAE